MPKDKQVMDERVGPWSAQYPFRIRSLTARDVQKIPGPERYSSRESGVPYVTVDLEWPGLLTVDVPDAEGAPDLKDPAVLGLAFQAILRWVKDNAADVGREVVADISLDREEAALDNVPSVDANEL